MNTPENPKLNLTYSVESCSPEETMTTNSQKLSASDHKSDTFVIDMESFSHRPNKDINQNSRITLQRSLSRKGSQRVEKKINNSNSTASDRDSFVASSPRGSSTPEKPVGAAVGTTIDHGGSKINPPIHHHQITLTSGSITSTASESRFPFRRNSFKRSAPPWLDPKRVLLIFATLSSMGTILLIYFTLSISKMNGDDNSLD
ncbi:hypothetical protein SLEP1_g29632 [Rubroshorea leprosula]|uniref:Uncharacterized protein n=1 Tax=Rubroshorea leprosula TaxID=152421 RepID=A0AAV5K3A5_9ROSI|nr:hypothetical protein SLEP1_g29632 [Rubroshorea leprosula]